MLSPCEEAPPPINFVMLPFFGRRKPPPPEFEREIRPAGDDIPLDDIVAVVGSGSRHIDYFRLSTMEKIGSHDLTFGSAWDCIHLGDGFLAISHFVSRPKLRILDQSNGTFRVIPGIRDGITITCERGLCPFPSLRTDDVPDTRLPPKDFFSTTANGICYLWDAAMLTPRQVYRNPSPECRFGSVATMQSNAKIAVGEISTLCAPTVPYTSGSGEKGPSTDSTRIFDVETGVCELSLEYITWRPQWTLVTNPTVNPSSLLVPNGDRVLGFDLREGGADPVTTIDTGIAFPRCLMSRLYRATDHLLCADLFGEEKGTIVVLDERKNGILRHLTVNEGDSTIVMSRVAHAEYGEMLCVSHNKGHCTKFQAETGEVLDFVEGLVDRRVFKICHLGGEE